MTEHDWQVASTIVQAVSSAVLVVITGWYAHLTRRLAKSAEDQALASAAQIEAAIEREDKARELRVKRALAAMQRAGAALNHLPVSAEDAADIKLRRSPLWEVSTVSAIERYGLELSLLGDDETAQFAEDMTWLLLRIREVRKTSSSTGFDYSRFEWENWTERLTRCQELLARAVTDIRYAEQESEEFPERAI